MKTPEQIRAARDAAQAELTAAESRRGASKTYRLQVWMAAATLSWVLGDEEYPHPYGALFGDVAEPDEADR